MPKPKKKVVATAPAVPPAPLLSLAELFAHFRPTGSTPVNPSQALDLIMELLAQDLLNDRYQGQPFEEKMLRCLMRYEALRLRRESLSLRQRKAKSADYFPEEAPKPFGAPDPAPPEVVEYINNIRRQMWGRLPEDSPAPDPVTPPATETETAPQPPVVEEPAPTVSAEPAVTTEDPANIPGTPEYEAKMAVARARIKELEAERDRLTQEAEDRWLRIQAIEAKQLAEQQASYDPRPFRNLVKRRRSKYDCL